MTTTVMILRLVGSENRDQSGLYKVDIGTLNDNVQFRPSGNSASSCVKGYYTFDELITEETTRQTLLSESLQLWTNDPPHLQFTCGNMNALLHKMKGNCLVLQSRISPETMVAILKTRSKAYMVNMLEQFFSVSDDSRQLQIQSFIDVGGSSTLVTFISEFRQNFVSNTTMSLILKLFCEVLKCDSHGIVNIIDIGFTQKIMQEIIELSKTVKQWCKEIVLLHNACNALNILLFIITEKPEFCDVLHKCNNTHTFTIFVDILNIVLHDRCQTECSEDIIVFANIIISIVNQLFAFSNIEIRQATIKELMNQEQKPDVFFPKKLHCFVSNMWSTKSCKISLDVLDQLTIYKRWLLHDDLQAFKDKVNSIDEDHIQKIETLGKFVHSISKDFQFKSTDLSGCVIVPDHVKHTIIEELNQSSFPFLCLICAEYLITTDLLLAMKITYTYCHGQTLQPQASLKTFPFIKSCCLLVGILLKSLCLTDTKNHVTDTQKNQCMPYLAFVSSIKEIFKPSFLKFASTYKEMQASPTDLDVVCNVVLDQLYMALAREPYSVSDFKKYLRNITYATLNEGWIVEWTEMYDKLFDSPSLCELKEIVEKRMINLIGNQRLGLLEKGSEMVHAVKPAYKCYFKLSQNHKSLELSCSEDGVDKTIYVDKIKQVSHTAVKKPSNKVKHLTKSDKLMTILYTNEEGVGEENETQCILYDIDNSQRSELSTDGLNYLLNQKMTSQCFKTELRTLVNLELKIRVLGLDLTRLEDEKPYIPNLPENFDFPDD